MFYRVLYNYVMNQCRFHDALGENRKRIKGTGTSAYCYIKGLI